MSKYDDLFDIQDESAAAKTTPAAAAPATSLKETIPSESATNWDELLKLEEEQPGAKPTPGATPDWLAAMLGGGAGLAFGAPAEIRGDVPLARMAERIYSAPAGSLATMGELGTPLSVDAIARQVAAQNMMAGTPSAVAPAELTPGEKWGAKTGYGAGPGTVQESSSRFQRSMGKGKVTSRLDKLYGPKLPGESSDLAQRLIDRAAAAEQVKAAQATQSAQAMRDIETAREAQRSTLGRMASDIRGAGRLSEGLQRGARTGFNVGAGALGGVQAYQGLTNMQRQGATPENIAQTAEGAGLLYGMRSPRIGLPIAGGAAMTQAGREMLKSGITPRNVARMVGGAGVAAMPFNPPAGAIAQIPSAAISALDWARQNPQQAQQLIDLGVFDAIPGQP